MLRKGDYKRDLVDYIKRNLKKGYTEDSLKWALVNQGNSKIEVERAIEIAEQELASEAPVLKTKPIIKYELVEPEAKDKNKKSFWKKIFG